MSKKVLLAMVMSMSVMFTAASAFADGGGWAVIVYNTENGHWGSSHGGSNRAEAEQIALNFCGAWCAGTTVQQLEYNSQYKTGAVRETFAQDGWVALAIGTGNTHWGSSGMHDTEYNAETSAYNNCGGAMNGCYILRSLASYRYGSDQNGVHPNP